MEQQKDVSPLAIAGVKLGMGKEFSQFTAHEFGELLRRIRAHIDKSQMEMAELLNVGFTTYQRWEQGERVPRAYNRRKIRDKFEATLYAWGILIRESDLESMGPRDDTASPPTTADQGRSPSTTLVVTEPPPPSAPFEEREEIVIVLPSSQDSNAIDTFLTGNMTMYLLEIAHARHVTCRKKMDTIQQGIKKFDTMHADNKNYHIITRRDALGSLATFPAIAFGLNKPEVVVASTQYGAVLEHCSASLEACWQLFKGQEARAIGLAFQCVSMYSPVITAIAQNSSHYQKEALDLATQYALVKTGLDLHCVGVSASIESANTALELSRETGNISFQLSAQQKLAWRYKRYPLGLQIAQKAVSSLEEYSADSGNEPLHPNIRGGIYATLALTLAKNKKSPEEALGKAIEATTRNEIYAFMDFKPSILLLETGKSYCHYGDQTKAMEALEQRVNPITFTVRIPQSEIGRLETLNFMTLSSLKSRNMEKAIHFFVPAAEGALVLQSKQRLREIVELYELMDVVWSGERRIEELYGLAEEASQSLQD